MLMLPRSDFIAPYFILFIIFILLYLLWHVWPGVMKPIFLFNLI